MTETTKAVAVGFALVGLVIGGVLLAVQAGPAEAIVAEPANAESADKDAKPSANDLSMEVVALRTIHQFKLNTEQMKALYKMAESTSQKGAARLEPKASKEFTKALQTLRDALVDNDDDAIDTAEEELETIRDAEEPELDDDVEITDEARRRTPEVFRMLKANKLAAYVAKNTDEFVDPLDRLTAALTGVRGLKGDEYSDFRDDVAGDVSRLVAGIQQRKADKINDRVDELLVKAHDLSDDDFKTKEAELKTAAKEIVGKTTAADVLRNVVEYTLAELLSNPRLAAAVEARLKL